jgi:DNA (cytosine-5)-methyltransferase 1
MNHLDLFSGIGGFSLGLEKAGFTTKAFCEMDPFCKLVLNKHWKDIPIYDNIKTLNGTQIEKDIGAIDIITGGFPCQPYSVAGKQKGTNDDRYLWPEMFRVIREVQPTFVIAENVKGLVNIQDGMVFETVCSDLESEGFEVQTFIIPAAGIGAPHKRERVWIVAYSDSNRHSNKIRGSSTKEERISQEHRQDHNTTRKSSGASSVWETNNQHVPNSSGKRSSSQSIGVNRELAEESSGEKKTRNKSTLCTSSLCSDVSNSNTRFSDGSQEEIQSRRSSRNEYVENSRRTLRQGSQFGTENENEIRKENANKSERSSKTREDVVADTESKRTGKNNERLRSGTSGISGREGTVRTQEDVANPSSEQSDSQNYGQEQREVSEPKQIKLGGRSSGTLWPSNWEFEPNVGRVANGIPGRAHRLKALGNAIVPQIAEEIGKAIMKVYHG